MSGHRAAELLCLRSVYRWGRGRSALCRPFFLARNDTHDGVDKGFDEPNTDRFVRPAIRQYGTNRLDNTESIVCGALLVLTNGRTQKLRSTFQPKIFERFLARTTKPCERKVRRTRQKGPKRLAEKLSWFGLSKPGNSPYPEYLSKLSTFHQGGKQTWQTRK